MNDHTDQQLLRDYAERQSEAAFAAIAQRYVDLVYSAAFRMVCDTHTAKDVTQCVFLALSQNARQLTDRPALAGWLHGTARNLATKSVRSEVRRRAREQEAAVMNELLSANPDTNWEHIAPYLDDALGELSEPDRDAVLLRYFKNHDLRTVGATLGISDDAAQKRVSRAVERLREFFAKRGVTVGASGLTVVISANAVQAAPVGLALTISTAGALTGTTLATTATITATKAIAMTALQKTIVTATIAGLAGIGIYEARQAAQLREQVQTLQQQQTPLAEQVQGLQQTGESAVQQMAALREDNERLNRNTAELLRLRGEIGGLRSASRELARLKNNHRSDQIADQNSLGLLFPASFSEVTVQQSERAASRMLDSLKPVLNLSSEQESKIRALLLEKRMLSTTNPGEFKRASNSQLLEMTLLPTIVSANVGSSRAASMEIEAQLKALLTPDQQLTYEEYRKAQTNATAKNLADAEAFEMQKLLNLTPEQQDKTSTVFQRIMLTEHETAKNPQSNDLTKWFLEQRLKDLDGILSSTQLDQYRQISLPTRN